MTEFIEKLRKGELSETEIKEFQSKLSDEGKKILDEARAYVDKRQDEQGKVKTLEEARVKLEADIKAEEERLSNLKNSGNQFKNEQVTVAENKFFADYKIPAEKQEEYRKKFKALESGHVTPELIYKDLEGVHAFINSSSLLKTDQDRARMEQQAAEEAARAAGGNGGAPAGEGDKKHSDAAKDLAKRADISEDAATKIEKEGMTRTLG